MLATIAARQDPVRFEVPEGSACGCCAGGSHHPASGQGGTPNADTSGLASYDWDDAAAHITRGGVSWGASRSSAQQDPGAPAASEPQVSVTFGFLSDDHLSEHGLRAMTQAEIGRIEYAMSIIADAADITFVRVTGADGTYLDSPADAQIDIEAMGGNGGLAATRWSGSTYTRATVTTGESGLEEAGSYAFTTALHEIAHAVGLSHPGDYDGSASYDRDAEYAQDSKQYTVMSYFGEEATGADFGRANPNGLMLHDIAALQHLYGANLDTRTGDTVYGFGSNTGDEGWTLTDAGDAIVAALWDAGGRDRLDVSGYADDQRIDLREEAFSDIGGLTANLAIARDVVIEDAVGGDGDDVLDGNNAGNVLAGGGGADLLFGGAGDDVLYGDGGPAVWAG